MRNVDMWLPTKFEPHQGSWRASRDPQHLAPSSRLAAERAVAAYAAAITGYARGDVIDLGCGHVPLYGAYRDLATTVTCVDWPQTLHPSPHLDVEADLTQPLPLPDVSYDTVLLTDVLEHLPRPDAIWSEIRRILRPGGVVIIGVPFLYWIHEQPHDYLRYTSYRLRLFAEDHGFDVLQCSAYGGATDVASDVVAKLLGARRYTRWLVPAVMWSGERIGRRFVGRETPLPLGYVLVARRGPDPV